MSGSLTRIGAIILRHLYLFRTSWARVIEMVYWPSVNIIIWGLINLFLATNSSFVAQAAGLLISATLLWDLLFRSQLGFSVSFLEEIWSRNLANLFVSPLSVGEYLTALMCLSFLRTLIAITLPAFLAIALYDFSLFSLGLPLVAFFALLLVFGCAVGMMLTALILRVGQGAENLAWMAIYAMMPISAVYYPVEVLPGWLQSVAWCLPTTPVFQGMRMILIEQRLDLSLLLHAALLDVLYLAIGAALFLWAFRNARQRGAILQVGE